MSSLANAQWLKGMAQKLRGHIHTLITPGSNSQEGLAILTRRATVKDATSRGRSEEHTSELQSQP